MKKNGLFLLGAAALFATTSCNTMSRTMREAETNVELHKEDFTISPQHTGTAVETKIIGIDWQRLFSQKTSEEGASVAGPMGMTFNVPIVGAYVPKKNRADGYALYDLYANHPGFDAVFYPSFDRKKFMIPIFYSRKEVTVTARLGKLKEE